MSAQSRLCSKNQKTEPAKPAPSQELFYAFVQQLQTSQTESADSRTEIGSEEILFDLEFEGWRYLLIRAAVPAKSQLQLSPREQEIVRMVAEGHPNKVIAVVLNISPWTVGTHLRRIFAKLGVGSRAAMVARCAEIAKSSNLLHPTSRYDWNTPSSPTTPTSRGCPRSQEEFSRRSTTNAKRLPFRGEFSLSHCP